MWGEAERLKYFNEREINRASLLNNWSKNIKHVDYKPSLDNNKPFGEQFAKIMNEVIQEINANKDKNKGVWYSFEYLPGNAKDVEFLANQNYFDGDIRLSSIGIFYGIEGSTPSQKLNSWLTGPTTADCGSVMQAASYKALEQLIGTAEFNKYFSKQISPFLITNQLWTNQANSSAHYLSYNPIHHFFEPQFSREFGSNFNDNEVEIGDIVYIKGVDRYSDKHPNGDLQGNNVFCVGKNKNREKLYTEFGSSDLLTYNQIREKLINAYNEEPSIDSQKTMRARIEANIISKLQVSQISLDQFDQGKEEIGGIVNIIRPSELKLESNLEKTAKWYDGTKGIEQSWVKTMDHGSVPSENKHASFDNYKTDTDKQKEMLRIARNFSFALQTDERPLGLIMTGQAGIGKTHLATAIVNSAIASGKKVYFLSPDTINQSVQKNKGYMEQEFQAEIDNADLIVYDDTNLSGHGGADKLFATALKTIITQNKAFIATSNTTIPLAKYISDAKIAIPYDHKINDNFYVADNLKGIDYRKTWYEDEKLDSPSDKPNETLFNILSEHTGAQAAGILVEADGIDDEYIEIYKTALLKNNPDLLIRIAQEPRTTTEGEFMVDEKVFENGKRTFTGRKIPAHIGVVKDMYMEDRDKFKGFIIKVTNIDEAKQFLNLLSHVHEKSCKIIVICNNKESFDHHIDIAMKSDFEKDREKLTARMKVILADQTSIVKEQNKSRSYQHSDP